MSNKKFKNYEIWFNQVNYCKLEVRAKDEDEAIDKAYKLWKKVVAHTTVEYIAEKKD